MEKIIKQFYPNAESGREVTKSCIEKLFNEYGFDPKKTILGTSVCSDEIVRSSTNFRDYLDHQNPFSLGGLGGFPFTGATGFGAFAAHIPDNGFAIIEYGPHIGVSKQGTVGNVQRMGQNLETTCCGALKACVSDIFDDKAGSRDSVLDYQQWMLEDQLIQESNKIKEHEEPLVEATEVMFNKIDKRIKRLLKATENSFKNTTVALVGGIIINTDFELPDWFDLREFSVKTYKN